MAQLRGASYHVVARNVRDDVGGSDSYSGPLWDLIRVEEPGTETTRESRPWRLYYINVQTGLIDKIVSEFAGVRIEANLSNGSTRLEKKFLHTLFGNAMRRRSRSFK